MIIETLVWQNVTVTHFSTRKQYKNRIDKMPMATIMIEDVPGNPVKIRERTSFGGGQTPMYTNGKLIKLTPWGIEIEAEYWGTKFLANGEMKALPKHKVKITATF